jgi:hypothetical protein
MIAVASPVAMKGDGDWESLFIGVLEMAACMVNKERTATKSE